MNSCSQFLKTSCNLQYNSEASQVLQIMEPPVLVLSKRISNLVWFGIGFGTPYSTHTKIP
jgi:hypothetical protein